MRKETLGAVLMAAFTWTLWVQGTVEFKFWRPMSEFDSKKNCEKEAVSKMANLVRRDGGAKLLTPTSAVTGSGLHIFARCFPKNFDPRTRK